MLVMKEVEEKEEGVVRCMGGGRRGRWCVRMYSGGGRGGGGDGG